MTSLATFASPEGWRHAEEVPAGVERDVVVVVSPVRELTIVEVAADFDVLPESVRRWVKQADVDDGVREWLTTPEQAEVVRLHQESAHPGRHNTTTTDKAPGSARRGG